MTTDQLAQIIREVDGNHNLGASQLAEAILEHPLFRQDSERTIPSGHPCDGAWWWSDGKTWMRLEDTLPRGGMEQLRDDFAKAALPVAQTIAERLPSSATMPILPMIAATAYQLADAMLAIREVK